MNRNLLLQEVRDILLKSGFLVTDEFIGQKICFDVIAKREKTILIIKVLLNIDSFNKSSANELKVISNCLNSSPMVIGNRSGSGQIEDGAVYLRYGIPIMSPHTVYDYFIEGVPPLVLAAPGGFFVNIDGELLKDIRQEKGMSLGNLAEALGVSRRAIQMYEDGMNAMVEIAIRLQDYLGEPVILPLDPLETDLASEDLGKYNKSTELKNDQNKEVVEQLNILGYDVIPTSHSPFDAITAKQKILILTGIERKPGYLKIRARTIHNISRLANKDSVFFVRKSKSPPNIEGTPAIALEELMTIDDYNEIIELIRERSS